MGRQIIKQPNGKYCIYSSIVDNITHYNMEAEDIINDRVEEYREKISSDIKGIISKLEANKKPYFQFTLSYKDMIEKISEYHGKKEGKKVDALINK